MRLHQISEAATPLWSPTLKVLTQHCGQLKPPSSIPSQHQMDSLLSNISRNTTWFNLATSEVICWGRVNNAAVESRVLPRWHPPELGHAAFHDLQIMCFWGRSLTINSQRQLVYSTSHHSVKKEEIFGCIGAELIQHKVGLVLKVSFVVTNSRMQKKTFTTIGNQFTGKGIQ